VEYESAICPRRRCWRRYRISRTIPRCNWVRQTLRNKLPVGHSDHQRHWLILDWRFCRLIRDQVGFTAVGSHFSDGWNLRGLHDFLDVLLLDSYYLMERGKLLAALAYMVGSVVLSICALVGGLYLARV
jgi:hypothetical protein